MITKQEIQNIKEKLIGTTTEIGILGLPYDESFLLRADQLLFLLDQANDADFWKKAHREDMSALIDTIKKISKEK